jgi:hypothetical protein
MSKRCSKCILPESFPGIRFDEAGVCNYCLAQKRARTRGREALLDLIRPYRDKHEKYDCIVAISGGRDSAFVAHYAVWELKLRVLGYTYDNGFMPEQTQANVRNTVSSLGIDHVTDNRDYMRKRVRHLVSSWMRRPSPAMIGFLCTGCRTGYVRGLVKTARDYGVPLVITGSGEPGQPFADKLLSIPIDSDKKELALVRGFMMEMVRNPRYISRPDCAMAFVREFYYRFLYRSGLRLVPLFRFVEWDESKILSLIQSELEWRTPAQSGTSWRSDCKIHLLRQYLYKETLGFTKNDALMSRMIRENMVTREEALRRLEDDNKIPEQFLTAFFDELGLRFSDLTVALRG